MQKEKKPFTNTSSLEDQIIEVELDKIVVNPHQPRRHFKNEELLELASSIKAVGLIHPPIVRALPGGELFEIISGERRFRAAKLANLTKIEVLLRSSDSSLSAQAALIENVQRVDLNPLEVALALQSLIDEFSFTQEELAQKIGKKIDNCQLLKTINSSPIHSGCTLSRYREHGACKSFALYFKCLSSRRAFSRDH